MTAGGHVFVTRGDLTRLACDAWLLPTDAGGYVTPGWGRDDDALATMIAALPSRTAELRSDRSAVLGDAEDRPQVVAVDTGGLGGEDPAWYVQAAQAGLARIDLNRRPLHRRRRLLVGMPFLGVGAGGGGDIKGELLLALLSAARDWTDRTGADLAFVVRNRRHLAAAQQARRYMATFSGRAWWPDLSGSEHELAADLAKRAREGQMVLFLGAGVSQAAGLPGWDELLGRLTEDTALEPDDPDFRRLDVLDKAVLIRRELGDERYFARMQAIFSGGRQAMAHQLLAALPVREAATTNDDTLFEETWRGDGDPVAVLPGASAAEARRWLLKLHGTIKAPESMVLCRDDYLRFDREGAAVAGIVQAMLVTRHMLFVGFSLNDDHFHRIAHDVRHTIGNRRDRPGQRPFATALSPTGGVYASRLWEGDIDVIDLSHGQGLAEGGRRVEQFLDLLLAEAHDPGAHLLDRSFDALWNPAERDLRDALEAAANRAEDPRVGPVRATIGRLLEGLGRERRA